MMVVRQNVLSTIMLKNVKLCYENVRFQLATSEKNKPRNLSSSLRITYFSKKKNRYLILIFKNSKNNNNFS